MTEKSSTADTGLIYAYLLNQHGGGRALNWSEINTQHSADELLWIHLDFSKQQTHRWIHAESGLDPALADAMLAEDSRPRSLQHGSGILTVLRGVNTNPGSDPEDMVSIRIWIDKHRIISTRRRRLLSIEDICTAIDAGRGPTSAGAFLIDVINRLGDRIEHVVDGLDGDIEEAEAVLAGGDGNSHRLHFGELRRQTARIRRYLAPQRDALDRLSRLQGEILSPDQCIQLHEQADRVTRNLEDLDLARERAMVAQEELLSMLAHDQNSKMVLLSIVAAIFLPLSFLTGLMGMNVAGLPGMENPLSFNILVALMTAIAVGIVVLFKLKKWF